MNVFLRFPAGAAAAAAGVFFGALAVFAEQQIRDGQGGGQTTTTRRGQQDVGVGQAVSGGHVPQLCQTRRMMNKLMKTHLVPEATA